MSKRGRNVWDMELGSLDTARLLMLLAQQHQHQRAGAVTGTAEAMGMSGRVFECKTCNRQFPTFQALGGHRASHKRPRLHQPQPQHALGSIDDDATLCLGRRASPAPPQHALGSIDDDATLCLGRRASPAPPQHALGSIDDNATLCLGRRASPAPPQPPRPRVHECPVCGLEFAVGQALGGHMRRHRVEAEAGYNPPSGKAPAPEMAASCDARGICLGLNMTPSGNCAKCRSVAGLGAPSGHMHRHRAEAEANAQSAKERWDKLERRQRYLPLHPSCGKLEDVDISIR